MPQNLRWPRAKAQRAMWAGRCGPATPLGGASEHMSLFVWRTGCRLKTFAPLGWYSFLRIGLFRGQGSQSRPPISNSVNRAATAQGRLLEFVIRFGHVGCWLAHLSLCDQVQSRRPVGKACYRWPCLHRKLITHSSASPSHRVW